MQKSSMQKKGIDILVNARLNKGTAFTREEREQYGLTGLLPHVVSTMEQQVERALTNFRRKNSDIEKYIFLASLQKRNERLYYRLLIDHTKELMPIVYTPTVGQACQEYANIFRETSGFYISLDDRGKIYDLFGNWPEEDVRLIVVTDGERILGLGDLGTNGMGIPIGKLALYCACAGVKPEQCLPITLDVGTDSDHIRDDPLYMGRREKRARGESYYTFIDEFIQAVKKRYPKALLQFEDFATTNAVTLLEQYRDELLCFNDDIQGTAAVALAGLVAATRINGKKLSDMHYLFMGAGSAATGIGHLLAIALEQEGLTKREAYARSAFIDSKGLVTKSRDDVTYHASPFAVDMEPMDLEQAIDALKPEVLIGATGRPGMFTRPVIEKMAAINQHPIIFALSNPTANAECTAEDAYRYSDGRAIFASGSPFDVVHIHGEIRVPGQGNNAYIFPGLGLGVLACEASCITDDMLIAATRTLAECVSENQLEQGCLYPPLHEIREVSVQIALAVARVASEKGLTSHVIDERFEEKLREELYDPRY